jgi:Predicted membrane protein
MAKAKHALLNWKPIVAAQQRTRSIVIPGADGMSLYDVGRFFIMELKSNRINVSCAAVTYNFLMAIPPTLLFLFSLVPYFPLHDVQTTILSTLRYLTPNAKAYSAVSDIVVDFMNNEQAGVLSSGILLTLFFSSNGMMMLLHNFDRTLPIYKKRSGLKKRWTAIKLTVMLIGVAIISLAVLIFQTTALNHIILSVFDNTLLPRLLSLIIVALIIFCAISFIYKYGPSLHDKFSFVSTGSVFATILCIIVTAVFFFLVNNFISYNKVYGSIGSIMAVMVWVWLNTLVILIGYELNVSILLAKTQREEDEAKN